MTLVEHICQRGGEVTVFDPVATQLAKPIFGDRVAYAKDAYEALLGCDVALIGTGWPDWLQLDWQQAKNAMRGNFVFDARNSLRGLNLPDGLERLQIGAGP